MKAYNQVVNDQKNHASNLYRKRNALFEKDIWYAKDLGLEADAAQSCYKLNFNKLNPAWFREAVKHFVYYQSAIKSYNSCRSYITGLTHFGYFIMNFQN